jgi:hypothetical protein
MAAMRKDFIVDAGSVWVVVETATTGRGDMADAARPVQSIRLTCPRLSLVVAYVLDEAVGQFNMERLAFVFAKLNASRRSQARQG